MERVSRSRTQQSSTNAISASANRLPRAPRNEPAPSSRATHESAMVQPAIRSHLSSAFRPHSAVAARDARAVQRNNTSIPSHSNISTSLRRLDIAPAYPGMRSDSRQNTNAASSRNAGRPQLARSTSTITNMSDNNDSGLVQDSASEGGARLGLFKKIRQACQQQLNQASSLSEEKNCFEVDLQKLASDLHQHSPTQSTRRYRNRLTALQGRFDTLFPRSVYSSIFRAKANEYAAKLEAIRQHLNVWTELRPVYEARAAFFDYQAQRSLESNRLALFAQMAEERLDTLTETRAQFTSHLPQNPALAARQLLEAELENISQEAKSLTLFLEAQNFFDHKLKAHKYPTHRNTPTARQARRDYKTLMEQWRTLQTSTSSLAQSQEPNAIIDFSKSPLMLAANDYVQAIESTMLARDALKTIESVYNTLEGKVPDVPANEVVALVDSLRDKLASSIDLLSDGRQPLSENSLLISHVNRPIKSFNQHVTCFQLFKEVDQLSKAFDENDVGRLDMLETCAELKNKFDALDEKSPEAPRKAVVGLGQVITVYEARFATVSREICLHCADLTQQSLTRERNNIDLQTALPEGRVSAHKRELEIAQDNIRAVLELGYLTPDESRSLRTILIILDKEITLYSELGNISDSMANFAAQSGDRATVKFARDAIAQHYKILSRCKKMDGADATLMAIQRACESKLLVFHENVARIDAYRSIGNAARMRRQVEKTLNSTSNSTSGNKEHQLRKLRRVIAILKKHKSEVNVLGSDTYRAVVAEKRRCQHAFAELEISLNTERVRETINKTEVRFGHLAISSDETLKLMERLHDLVDHVLQQSAEKVQKAKWLRNLYWNTSLSLRKLRAQLITITYTRHLSPQSKESLAQWCSRLMQSPVALNANDNEQIKAFATMVEKSLEAIRANRSTLAQDLVSKVTDAACTDWGTKILIDMQAIILSHKLTDALSKQLRSAGQEAGESRLRTLETFIDDHRQDFVSLLNFSAFQSVTNDKAIVDPSDKESIQAYLLFYLTAKEEFLLPGDASVDHMTYHDFTLDSVLGGEDSANDKYQTVENTLEAAQGPLKGHYLNQLSDFFNIHIWKEVLAALPGQASREAQIQLTRAELIKRVDALTDQLSNAEISQKKYDAELESLNTSIRALDNSPSEVQTQYAERLMARISDTSSAAES